MASKARIMVVEDEGIVAMDIQTSLESLGYAAPDLALSGEEAVELAAVVKPDLILMDIRLGDGMDGIDTAMLIGDALDVPIVYLTAYTDEQSLDRAKMTQPFGYLVKPFAQKELQTTIEMALHKHSMDRQLREREQWLEATLRSIGDGVIATSPEGRIRFMNPAAQDMTGWLEEDALDRDLERVLPLQDAKGGELPVHPGREALATGRPIHESGELSLVSRTGRTHQLEDSAAPIQTLRGSLEGMVMVLRDASRRKAAEKIHRLEEDRYSQIQKMDAMGRFAGGIAHDFNNHLSVIMGVSEMLASDLEEEPERKGMLEEIRKACRSSVGLTRQLQAFARKGNFTLRPMDLNEAVRDLEKLIRRVLGPEFTVRVDLAPRFESILADQACLEQVIMNLALNARDSMPRGGTVSISTSLEILSDPTLPFVFPLVPGHYALLKVADTGYGVPPEVRPHLFEPFFTYKVGSRGAGLGLAMVYGMTKHLRGNLQIYSEPGLGSAFSVYFPVPGSPIGPDFPGVG